MAETVYDGDEWRSDEERINQDVGRAGREVQVPETLLPGVLHRLGLAREPYQIEEPLEIVVEDVVLNLSSDDWQTRIAAVRRLGTLGERVPVELLNAALDDKDSSVRAAAVHVLGCAGKRAPLPRLMIALHDADWHVRETAVLVLGNLRQDVPSAELNAALYDEDDVVRQAARLALHIDDESPMKKNTFGPYGRLEEQRRMQESQNPSLQGREDHPFETQFEAQKQDGGYREYAHTLHEQTQTYAPQEHFAYERAAPRSEHWEKVTNLPARKSQRHWWIIVAATAVLFFMLGSGVTRMTEPVKVFPFPITMSKELPKPLDGFNFEKPEYALLIQKDVSAGLKMSPDSIRGQLKSGRSLSDIAAEQGISEGQLQQIELQALTDASKAALAPNSEQAQKMMGQLKDNPQAMNKLVTSAFLSNS